MGIRSVIYRNIDWILEKISYFLAPVISYMALYGIGSEKFLRSGVLPVSIDHYQPIPDIHELQKREVWKKISNLPGVDWRPEHQLNNLYKIAEKFKTECKWPYEKPIDSSQFYLGNGTFSFGCAASLHCMIRYYKPDRIIEVGSGNSSLIIHEAIKLNFNENNKRVQYTVIDPYPRREIVEKIHNDTEIIIEKVENINLTTFKDLHESDILFIDSSHMAKTGSDVNYLILDVLPNLNQGVIIHFHDIPMPYEYPEIYALNPKFRVFWNESYLLQAFLSCNNKFEILMGMRYLMTTYVNEFSSIFPFFDMNRHPIISSSFWIKKMSFNDKKELTILFLASWYPSDQEPISGIFIQRHAQAVSRFCNVIILFIRYDEMIKHRELIYTYENGIHTFRMNIPVDIKSFVFTRNIKNRLINNFFINALFGYSKIVKKFGTPDIIQVNVIKTSMTDMGFFALLIKIFLGIPYIIVEHSSEYLTKITGFFSLLKIRMVLKYAKVVLPVSTILKNSLKSIQNNNYIVVKNVVDTDYFIPPKKVRKHQKKIILHVSLLDDSTKNVSGIIKAVSELWKIRNDFELHIVGDGVDKKTLENLAMDLQGKTQYIFFYGALMKEELLKKYQEADVFILNSIQETFGCVIIEALSCGVPVISTRCGGPEDIITPETGILIDINDKKQLINAIQLILNEKYIFKPEIMHNYVVDNYGFDIIGKSLMDIYCSIVK